MKYPILFSLSLLTSSLFAQSRDDYGLYVDSVQGYSTLFRGELTLVYGVMAPNDGSTYFAYSEKFEQGNVLFRGKWYRGVQLNLNAHRDELNIISPVQGIILSLNKQAVDSFSFGNHAFVHYRSGEFSLLGNGYYQVLFEGNVKLYKKIRRQYYGRIEYANFQKGYTLFEDFYLWKEKRWHKIGTKGDLIKLYADQKRVINNLLRSKGLRFKKDREVSLIEILYLLDNQ